MARVDGAISVSFGLGGAAGGEFVPAAGVEQSEAEKALIIVLLVNFLSVGHVMSKKDLIFSLFCGKLYPLNI